MWRVVTEMGIEAVVNTFGTDFFSNSDRVIIAETNDERFIPANGEFSRTSGTFVECVHTVNVINGIIVDEDSFEGDSFPTPTIAIVEKFDNYVIGPKRRFYGI